MSLDLLVLDSGEWLLGDELAASPWYVLIYRQMGKPRNELHLWLPRQDSPRTGNYACRRYWVDSGTRWCVEAPEDSRRGRGRAPARIRFTAPDGVVLWADSTTGLGLGDLSESQLSRLLETANAGSYSGV